MDILAQRQCRHPLQPMGGVCATCLKERLSKLSGLCCKSNTAMASNADTKLTKQPSTTAPPLKQLLGQKSDLCRHLASASGMSLEDMTMSEGITEARQSIAYLIERDIVEAHRRYSDVASRCVPSADNQLLRSKSTSQLDAYSRLDGKSLHLSSSHRWSQSSRKSLKLKKSKESMASSAMKPLVEYHDHQNGTTPSPQCLRNGGKLIMLEFQGKPQLPHLIKSRSTGWILNHHSMCDRNKSSERRSPINFFSWNKKRKTSNSTAEDSAPLMMPPCNIRKTKDMVWRPLKVLFRWRVIPKKPFFTPSTASSNTSRPTSSSSSCAQSTASERKRHSDVSLPKLENHVELERVICGSQPHGLLLKLRGHNVYRDGVMNSSDKKMDVDTSEKQNMCCPREVGFRFRDMSQDVDSLQQSEKIPSSALGQGNRGCLGGKVPLESGQGTNATAKGRLGNESIESPKPFNRSMKVSNNALGVSSSSSVRESFSRSMLSSLSSSSPSLASCLDTSISYSNLKAKPDNTCMASIAALMSIDVNTASPLKMAC